MKRLITLITLCLLPLWTFGQNLEFFKILSRDSILFYFNESGLIRSKYAAKYYRISNIDPISLNLTGGNYHYTFKGKLIYQSMYSNGNLNGNVSSFFPDGNLRYTGYFKNSKRDSLWRFYYPEGSIEKIIIYDQDNPYLKEYYDKDGTPVFVDGNGKYYGEIFINEQPIIYKISGDIKDGKQDGVWDVKGKYKSLGINWTVNYKNGVLLDEINYNSSITGYDINENIDLFRFEANAFVLNNQFVDAHLLKYKSSSKLTTSFIPDLSQKINQICNENKIDEFLCLLQFNINTKNQVEGATCYSTNELLEIPLLQYINSLIDFETLKQDNKPVACGIYIPVLFQNGKIIIPDFSFNSSNKVNFMNVIP